MSEPFADGYAAALVAEATRRSGLVWLAPLEGGRARPAWHVWREGAVYVVHEGREQRLPWLRAAERVRVTARSKDKGGRLVTWLARPVPVEPGAPEWDAAVADLHAARLNPPDGEQQPARWARESLVTRLEPTGELLEQPGALPTGSLAAPPPPTPATTRTPLPFVVGPRPGRRRRRGAGP